METKIIINMHQEEFDTLIDFMQSEIARDLDPELYDHDQVNTLRRLLNKMKDGSNILDQWRRDDSASEAVKSIVEKMSDYPPLIQVEQLSMVRKGIQKNLDRALEAAEQTLEAISEANRKLSHDVAAEESKKGGKK